MPHKRILKIVLLYLLFHINIISLSFHAGIGIFQGSDDYLLSLDFAIEDSVTINKTKIHQFNYAFFIPLFISFKTYPFIYGVPSNLPNNNYFLVFQDYKYLSTYLKKFDFDFKYSKEQSKNISFGIKPFKQNFVSNDIWGSPFYDPIFPTLGSNFFIESTFFELHSSSIQNPYFYLIKSKGYFFTQPLWKLLKIQPTFWVSFKTKNNLGGSLEVDVPFYYFQKSQYIGFSYNISFFHLYKNNRSSYRILSSIWYEVRSYRFHLGGIFQEKNHRLGSSLSSLYPSTQLLTTFIQNNHIGGFYFQLQPIKIKDWGINFTYEYYHSVKPVSTIKLNVYVYINDIRFSLLYLRDKLIQVQDIAKLNNSDSYLGINFEAFLIEKVLHLGVSVFMNHAQSRSTVKSQIYTHWVF